MLVVTVSVGKGTAVPRLKRLEVMFASAPMRPVVRSPHKRDAPCANRHSYAAASRETSANHPETERSAMLRCRARARLSGAMFAGKVA
jgi:hypothetical protein